jgi:ribosomal protein L37AE/L43A
MSWSDLIAQGQTSLSDRESFDARERNYKIAISAALRTAMEAARDGGGWQSLLKKAFTLKTDGQPYNLSNFRQHDWLTKLPKASQEPVRAVLASFLDEPDAELRFQSYADLASGFAGKQGSTAGAVLLIGSILNSAVDPQNLPPVRTTVFEYAERHVEHPIPKGSTVAKYLHHLEFARLVKRKLGAAGLEINDLLDVQSILWDFYRSRAGQKASSTTLQPDGQCWSLLTIAGERNHQGNGGYIDVPDASYRWDSTVANHALLAAGDTVVVRDAQNVIGIALIESLTKVNGQPKDRFRCPECTSTKFTKRTVASPPYRCGKCKATFLEPEVEPIFVTSYEAHYASSWRAFEGDLALEDLKAITNGSYRHSIRSVDKAQLNKLLEKAGWAGRPWELFSPESRKGQKNLSPAGGTKFGKGRWRLGQAAFRKILLGRDGEVCAISGPQPTSVLDAAHWVPFASTQSHELAHGLLLRKDIHRLVDRNDITICPEGWTVLVNPCLEGFPDIWKFQGKPIAIREDVLDPLVIADHWNFSIATWEHAAT